MSNIRIVLAEDHVVVRQGTRQLLEQESDFEIVGEANDGNEAVQMVSQLKPDIVIMDVAMPKLSGIEATKQIKEILPATIILVLTGYDYDEYIFSMLEAGAAGFVLKRTAVNDLVPAIESVLQNVPYVSPAALDEKTRRPGHA